MYDSLMQMGRWFGYRQGYEDLVRVHTTEHLYSGLSGWSKPGMRSARHRSLRHAGRESRGCCRTYSLA